MALPGQAEKSKKQKKPKASSTNPLKGLIPAISIASISFLVLFGALFYLSVYQPGQVALQQQIKAKNQQATGQLNLFLGELQKQTHALASHPTLLQALQQNHDPQHLSHLENLLALGHDTEIRIFSTNLEKETPEKTGFAALDLARRSLKGNKLPPEAARIDNQWRVLVASPIRQGEVTIGTVLLSAPMTSLQKSLQLIGAEQGEIKIFQAGNSTNRPVLTLGTPSISASEITTLPGSGWKVSFAPSASLAAGMTLPWWPLAAAFVLSLLVTVVLLRFTARRAQPEPTIAITPHTTPVQASPKAKPEPAPQKAPPARKETAPATEQTEAAKPETAKTPKPIKTPTPVETDKQEPQPPQEPERPKNEPVIPPAADKTMPEESSEEEFASPLFQDIDDEAFGDLESLELPEDVTPEDLPEPLQSAKPATPKVPANIFRAYDIRGVVESDLTPNTVVQIGKAVGSEALERGENTIIVANDGRLSSPAIREQLIEGLTATGCHVVSIGTVPTPVLYFATHTLQASSGVMITGSHNPANYNGFKIVLGGEALSGEEIQSLYTRICEQRFSAGTGQVSSEEILPAYQKRILDDVVLARPLKIVIDCGNGVAGNTAPQLFEQLGCDVIPLYCDIDGNFPHHHPDPGQPENLQDLISKVKELQADMGIAFDGDGDRVGLVTNEGTIVPADRLLMILAKDVVSRNPGADIIFDVKCTRRLNALISGYGGRPVMWKSGHSLIKSKMKETGALLAGEMSGHIFFKERWYGFDDGIYSAARLTEILTAEPKDVETVFQALPVTVATPEINVVVSDSKKFELIQLLSQKANFGEGNINTLDGIRVDYPWGWGLIRASNTTPSLAFRFEADNDDGLQKVQSIFREQLNSVEPNLTLPF